jgi:hypothetical protein
MTLKRLKKFRSSKSWAKAKKLAAYSNIGAKTKEGRAMTLERAFYPTKTTTRLKLQQYLKEH